MRAEKKASWDKEIPADIENQWIIWTCILQQMKNKSLLKTSKHSNHAFYVTRILREQSQRVTYMNLPKIQRHIIHPGIFTYCNVKNSS